MSEEYNITRPIAENYDNLKEISRYATCIGIALAVFVLVALYYFNGKLVIPQEQGDHICYLITGVPQATALVILGEFTCNIPQEIAEQIRQIQLQQSKEEGGLNDTLS